MSQYGSTTTIENDGPAGRPSRWAPRPALTPLVVTEPAGPTALGPTVTVPDHVPAFDPVVAPPAVPELEAPATASPWDHTDPQVWFRALLVPGVLLLAVVVVAVVAITAPA